VLNVSEKNLGQLSCKVADTQKILLHRGVHWVSVEVQILLLDCLLNSNPINNVLLGTVFNSYET